MKLRAFATGIFAVTMTTAITAQQPPSKTPQNPGSTIRQTPASQRQLNTTLAEPVISSNEKHAPLTAANELEVSVHAHLLQANSAEEHDGKLTLTIVSELDGPKKTADGFMIQQPRLILRLPLASVSEAYGESRSCNISREGGVTFIFTAGIDEKNFIDFAPGADREFRFSVNKYLCRALAAPFECKGFAGTSMQRFPPEMARWKVGAFTSVELQSKNTIARADAGPVAITAGGQPFDYARCATVAPSNGLCCVAHRTTEWHCSGKPTGEGWHQVSGDCYHRETGTSCTE